MTDVSEEYLLVPDVLGPVFALVSLVSIEVKTSDDRPVGWWVSFNVRSAGRLVGVFQYPVSQTVGGCISMSGRTVGWWVYFNVRSAGRLVGVFQYPVGRWVYFNVWSAGQLVGVFQYLVSRLV